MVFCRLQKKATPQVIERETGMSKAAFKRAVGRLLKTGKIQITNGVIRVGRTKSQAVVLKMKRCAEKRQIIKRIVNRGVGNT